MCPSKTETLPMWRFTSLPNWNKIEVQACSRLKKKEERCWNLLQHFCFRLRNGCRHMTKLTIEHTQNYLLEKQLRKPQRINFQFFTHSTTCLRLLSAHLLRFSRIIAHGKRRQPTNKTRTPVYPTTVLILFPPRGTEIIQIVTLPAFNRNEKKIRQHWSTKNYNMTSRETRYNFRNNAMPV